MNTVFEASYTELCEAKEEIDRLRAEVEAGIEQLRAENAKLREYFDDGLKREADMRTELRRLRAALERSVKLQSHYAGILNNYDGGKRMQFADAQAWLDRLDALNEETK